MSYVVRSVRHLKFRQHGIRAQLRFDGHRLPVRSRPGRDCTAEFHELAGIGERLRGHRVILDGELVCFGSDPRTEFTALRARVGRRGGRMAGQRRPVRLVAFDGLHLSREAMEILVPCVLRGELCSAAVRQPRA